MDMSEESNGVGPQESGDSPELNKLRLRFGDALQLQLVGEAERYHIRLIGYLENRSIIVTTPVKNRRLISVRAGQSINVRMMVNDRVCAFNTTIVHLYRLPYPHMHIEYPNELETNYVRKSVRVEARVNGNVVNNAIGDRAKEINCHLVDISESGAHMVTPIRIGKSGDEITLTLQLTIADITRTVEVPSILKGRLKVMKVMKERFTMVLNSYHCGISKG
ncbi:MAG: c-di-GMP-binding flagellar brake protein YcgR [Candidatus Azotimanducaceae bacterium]|jgi:c-di-GMP-binding flagellar brake protein YcgR